MKAAQCSVLIFVMLFGMIAMATIGSSSAKPKKYKPSSPPPQHQQQDLKSQEFEFESFMIHVLGKAQNFTNLNDLVEFLEKIETDDLVCDSQETFYLWDLLPVKIRFGLLKKVSSLTSETIDFVGKTNWDSLSEGLKDSIFSFVSGFAPVKLNVCISKTRLKEQVCLALGNIMDKKLQDQLNFVYKASSGAIMSD